MLNAILGEESAEEQDESYTAADSVYCYIFKSLLSTFHLNDAQCYVSQSALHHSNHLETSFATEQSLRTISGLNNPSAMNIHLAEMYVHGYSRLTYEAQCFWYSTGKKQHTLVVPHAN